MNKKLPRILGVALTVAVMASLVVAATPASANELEWSRYKDPRQVPNQIAAAAGQNILDIATSADGNTIYAATGAVGSKIYKSTNGGKTFSGLTTTLGTVDMVAVAPDNANVVAILDSTAAALVLHVSTNGGSSWSNLAIPGASIAVATDLAVSPLDGSARYIAVAGAATSPIADNDDPVLMYFNLGASVPAWTDAVAGATWNAGAGLGTGFTVAAAPNDTNEIDVIRAIAFSPNFSSDLTAVAVSEQFGVAAQTGKMRYHMISFNQKQWDTTAGFTDYPRIVQSASAVAAAYTVNRARIALDPNYFGGDDTSRVAFIAAQVTDAAAERGGIFRMSNVTVKQLTPTDTAFWSVDWDGSVLVAGPQGNNQVRYSTNALATDPTVSSTTNLRRPGFATATNTIVAWAGANVVAGNSGAGLSAFAISTDKAVTFADVALIDFVAGSAWANVQDAWVAADGSVAYVTTDDGTNSMLWKRTGNDWQRIWTRLGTGTAGQFLVRGPAGDKEVLYIADRTGTAMWFTQNGGGTWMPRASRYAIADVAVEDIDVAYVAVNAAGQVSKTSNKGFTWADAKGVSFGAGTSYSLVSVGKGKLIAGSNAGYISYSVDGNANWTKIDAVLNGAGNAIGVAATLDSGDYVYAVTDADAVVERWQIGQSGTTWRNLGATTGGATAPLSRGIALVGGIPYILFSDGLTDSSIARTLNPTALAPTWSNTALDVAVPAAMIPSGLRNSAGSTVLWIVDAGTENVRVYTDSLATAKPSISGPAEIKVNPASGNPYNIVFTWDRPHSASTVATTYHLQVSDNKDFVGTVVNNVAVVAGSTLSNLAFSQLGAGVVMPGTEYFYRLRVATNGPLHSPWSDVKSFKVSLLDEIPLEIINPQPPVTVPPAPTPTITVQPPDVIVTVPPAPPAPEPVTPAYIWAIIAIGAVLVIAIIVLIVRTRRVV